MVDREDIKSAYSRIKSNLRFTPTLDIEAGALCENTPVSLKLELFQVTGSFKVRGALNALLAADMPRAGVTAFSGGNHGAAIAYAATSLGIASRIFTPKFAGATKIDRMRHFGAEVTVSDSHVPQILQECEDYAHSSGARVVHPYDDPFVMAGQGTVALEIEQQLPDLDTLFVSVGGGGLVGGVSAWFGGRIKIVAVESEGAATYANALVNGPDAEIVPEGVAASALGAASIGKVPWKTLEKFRPQSMVVTDSDIVDAQKTLWDVARIVGESGAATALAPLTSGAYKPQKGERIGVLICGGNTQPDWFMN